MFGDDVEALLFRLFSLEGEVSTLTALDEARLQSPSALEGVTGEGFVARTESADEEIVVLAIAFRAASRGAVSYPEMLFACFCCASSTFEGLYILTSSAGVKPGLTLLSFRMLLASRCKDEDAFRCLAGFRLLLTYHLLVCFLG